MLQCSSLRCQLCWSRVSIHSSANLRSSAIKHTNERNASEDTFLARGWTYFVTKPCATRAYWKFGCIGTLLLRQMLFSPKSQPMSWYHCKRHATGSKVPISLLQLAWQRMCRHRSQETPIPLNLSLASKPCKLQTKVAKYRFFSVRSTEAHLGFSSRLWSLPMIVAETW